MKNKSITLLGKSFCLLVWLLSSFAVTAQPKGNLTLSKAQMIQSLKETQNTISFVENKGQWSSEVKIAGKTNIGNVYVTNNHLHFLSFEEMEHEEHEEGEEHEETEEDEEKEAEEWAHRRVHGWGIYMDGANANYTISKEKDLITKYNYLIGETHHGTDASSFGELTLNNIYQGIDLRIYSQQENVMEFDWLVDAGTDFRNIKMRFKGQNALRVDEKGNLGVKLEFDEVLFDIPEAYQVINGKKVNVQMAFTLEGDVASFKALSPIDNRYALVIDPSVKWGTYFDNNSNAFDEYLFAVDVDNQGNVYCAGNINVQLTSGAGNYIDPASLFGLSSAYQGSVDGIIYKFNPNGTAIMAITYFGSTANDRMYGMALSPDKSTIMFCGLTAGTIPSGSTAAFDNSRNGTDGFIGVLNANTLNTLSYTTYLGDAGTDELVTIRPLSNNSFVVGGTVGAAVPAAYISNAYDPNYSGNTEMYIAKFTSFNTLTFGTYMGGTGTEQLNDIQIYSDGDIAFSGSSGSATSFPALFNNAANAVANTTGGLDGVLGVLNANGGAGVGGVRTLSRFGGTADDEFYGVTIGPFDTLFVTGFTSSTNFYLGPNSAGRRFRTVSRGGQDGFIGKFPKTGWNGGVTDPWNATYFGGSGNDRGNTLRTYTPYAVMVFGETSSTATDTTNRFPCRNLSDGGSFYDSTHNGGTWDIFYFVLGTDLQNLYFSTYIGGSANDYLGQTGTPHGSNHFVVEGDSLICLGTTIHSYQNIAPNNQPLNPNPITAGTFDPVNSTAGDDIHLIFKWRIGILLNFDYADAPLSYGTPNHVVFNSLMIGSRIDREDFAQPSYRAYRDDSAWSGTPLVPAQDDEDGITGTGTYGTQVYVQDTSTRFTQVVNVTNNTGTTAILCGWIDFNRSGTFGDAPYEVDTVLVPSGATTATLRWTGYNVGGNPYFNNTNDTTYMRLRLTTQSAFFVTNPSPLLNASNGEVEDYMVLRFHCVNLTTATIDTNSTTACGTATGSIVITNDTLIAGVQYGVYYSRNGGPLQGPFFFTTTGSGNTGGILTISGLTAGTYTAVQVFHPTNPACGFTLPGTYVILDPNVPGAPTVANPVPNPVCTGNSFSITATGQTGATFLWTGPGGFTFTGNPLTRTNVTMSMAGTYFVTQVVSNCTSSAGSTVLSVVQTPGIVSLAGTNPSTCGGTNGSITVNGLTAGTNYTINFTLDPSTPLSFTGTANGSGQVIITGLGVGTYRNFTAVTTIGNCSSPNFVGPVTLTNPNPPGQPTASVSPANLCVGNSFTLTASGVPGATFAWTGPNGFTGSGSPLVVSNAQTTNTGNYQVVQTFNNCPSIPSANVSVTVNPNPVISGTSSTNPTSCGGSQGTITLTGLTNGVTYVVNYTRNPSTPQSANIVASGGAVVITGLSAGTYSNFTVTVQSTGCVSNTIAGPITLTDPSTPAAPTVSSNSPICSGTTLTLFASGTGTSYNWTSNVGFTSSQQNPTRPNATTSMSGQYCATTTSNQCTSPQACINVTVNQTPAITGTTGVNPTTCSGTNGSITISGLTNGLSYNVVYTKTPGGLQSAGPLTANASGQITITGLSAGLYTNFTVSVVFTGVTCTSASFPGNVTLSDPSTPAAPTVGSNSPVCSGNSITLTASGAGTSFTWTGPGFTSNQQNPVISNATTAMSGSYCATQTLANCTSPQACVSVTVNQTPSISGTASTNPTTCLGAQGTITLSGLDPSTTYTLNYDKNSVAQGPVSDTSNASGQIVITGLTAGTYANFRVTLLGCTSPTIAGPVTLTDPATPSAPTAGSNSPVCSGGTINLTASGSGSGYSWTGPGFTSTTQNPSIPNATTAMTGQYCVTQTISNCTSAPGCVNVTVNPTPTISFSSSSNPTTCGGSNGSITLSGLSANTTYLVNYIKTPPGTAQGPIPILSNASGQIVITGLTAGSYSNFTATLTGCSSSTLAGPISLSDPTTPAAPTVTGSTPVCSGNTISLTASGVALATYSWTGPGFSSTAQNPTIPNATTAMTGSYCATQTLNACTSVPACTSVVVNQTPTFAIGGSTNPTTCLGNQGTITLSGVNAGANYTVTYLFGATPQATSLTANAFGQLVISGLTAGTYSNFVITLVSTGCPSGTVVGPVTLTDPANPTPPTLSSNSPACYGDTLKLFASNVAGGSYSWSGPGGYISTAQNPTRPSAVPAMSGTYSVTVTVANCNSTPATISVTVTSCPPVAVNDNYTTPEDVTLTITGAGNLLSNDSDPANPQQPLTVNTTPACNPQHGSVTILANGNFTYIPNSDYTGLDTFCYTVCDNEVPPACATALAIITVTPINDPPVVNDSTVTTPEDVPLTVCLPITDPESSTQAHSVTLCGGPSNGSLNGTLGTNNGSIPHTVCFTYTPTTNYSGTDQICLVICDNGSPVLCDTARVTINVTPVNDPPVAIDDYYTNCVGAPIVNNVMTNDSDVDGPLVTALGVLVPPVSGTVTLAGTGAFTYTPPSPLFNGVDSFRYVICDGGSPTLCDTATAVLDYRCVNVPPIARDDNYSTNEDQTLTINAPGVMSNDNDPDGGTITVTVPQLTGPSNGTLTLNADGSFTYVPNPNYTGPDQFTYSICDNGTPSKCDTATVFITVLPVNDPPVVVDSVINTCEDCPPVTLCLPINDVETDQDYYVSTLLCGPNSGSVTTTVNNTSNILCVTYDSNNNFNGLDSVCVVICDNGTPNLCDTTRIRITVTPVNDQPIAVNDNYTTTEDNPIVTSSVTGVRNNDNDNADGNSVTSLTVNTTPVVAPAHSSSFTLNADGSFTYVPVNNYCGTDSFQYQVCDAGTPLPSLCDTATAYITITCVNEPPVVVDTPITTCEDCGPITVCIPVTDPDVNTTTTIAGVFCGPNSGTYSSSLVLNTLCVTYTSNTNFNGLDSICVVVCDNGTPQLCDTTHITITVTPVNDPPVAVNDNYSTSEDVTLTIPTGTGVRANDNDNADGNPVTSLTVTTTPIIPPVNGTLTLNADGSFTYIPNPNYSGLDSFQYRICDNGTPLPSLCDTATAYITIVPSNDPPVVVDTPITTPEDNPITICIPISDPETSTQQHTVSFCDVPDNGIITSGPIVNNGVNPHTVCITYSPNLNFNGLDSICLTVCDNGIPALCDNTIIRITVTPVNDPPVAVNNSYTTTENTNVVTNSSTGVRPNDNDNADGNPVTSLTVNTTPVIPPVNGTVTLNSDGSFTYIPNPNYNGLDSFQYQICDAGTPLPSLCDTATVYITITNVNYPPDIPDTTVTTCEDCPVTFCVPFTDQDVTDIHTVTVGCPPVNGTVSGLTINQSTNTICFTYTGYANIHGLDSLCLIVCDNGNPSLCDTSTIIITVTPVNDPPYADTIYAVTYENTPIGVNVAAATGDLEGDPLTYTYGGVIPNSGTYGITGNGAIVFVPNPGFTGTVTIPYSVCDLSPYLVNVLCDSAAIVITVLPTGDTLSNHAPLASNDYVTTPINTSIVVNELANDYDPDGDPLSVTVTGPPSNGTYTVNPNGTINYTPNTGFFGSDTIDYVICDPVGTTQPRPLCDNAMVIIFISRDPESVPNDAPVAVDDFATICADANATVNVLLNDNDPNGDAITSVTIIDGVNNGTTSNPGLGLYIYDPNTGFSGTDTLTYQICDNGTPSLCDTAIVVFTVNPTPVITPSASSLTTCSGDAVSITFTSNVSGTVFAWSGSNGTSGTGNISTTLTNSGTTNVTVTYTVTGVAGGGCGSNTLSIPVTVRPRPVVTFSQNNTTFCSGDQVVVNLFSTIPSTTFTWSGSNGTNGTGNIITDNPTNTGSTDVTVTYTVNSSFNGCSGAPVTVTVVVKPRPTLTATPPTQTVCSGTPITINIVSSISGSSVNWIGSNGNSGNTFTINDSPLNFGTSNITVTYTINGQYNGCAGATTTATVVVRPRVVADAGQDKNVTACSASCVSLGGSPTGNGGSGTLTYAWSPSAGLNDSTFANPTACNVNTQTTYTVTVTDVSGCSATDAMTITVTPSSLTAEAGVGGALCLGTGDSVMLGGFPTAVGGTPTYTYTWFPTTGLNLTNQANPEAFPISTTTYYLTVTDALGCTSVDSTVVTVYPVLTANAGRDTAVCATFGAPLGGNPTATGGSGGGYTYTWSPSTGLDNINSANPVATFASSVVVTYSVTVLDGNGCSATDNAVVTVYPNPIAQAGLDKILTTCPGDSVVLGDNPAVTSGTGPYTYSWTPTTGFTGASNIPNPVIKGLAPGTYTYTLNVIDANLCSSSDNVIVTVVPNTLQAQAGNDESVCSNNNCVQIGGLPTAIGGTSPYSYLWSNGGSLSDSTASNPLACPTLGTNYSVTVTDSKGCTATDAEFVTVNPAPAASAGPDTSVCFGNNVLIGGNPTAAGGTPGYTYSWTPTIGLSLPNVANPSAAPTVVTTYQLIVTDSKGCSNFDEVTVTPRSTPVVDAGADKSITQCPNDTAFIGNIPVVVSGGTGPYSYDWTPGIALSDSTIENPFVVGLGSTTSYQIIVTDVYGCQGVDYVIVNVTPNTLQVDAGNGGALCASAGSSIVIGGNPTAAGGTTPYVYAWASSIGGFSSNLANPTVTPTGTTTYYVTVTDAKGCSQTDSVVVTINAAPAVDAGRDSTICSGFCVTIGSTPTGSAGTTPYQYSWTPTLGLNANNTANPLACPLITTTYTVQLTDSNGCVATDAVTITVRPNPVANAGVDRTLVNCGSDSVQIGGSPSATGGTPAYTYAWSPATGLVSPVTSTNPWVRGLTASQLYTLVVTDVNGCTASDAVLVNVVPSSLVADAGNGGAYCAGSGGSITLGGSPTANGGTAPFAYTWSGGLPATSNPVAGPSSTTKYFVTVVDSKGCISVDSVTVIVNPSPIASAGIDTAVCAGESVALGGEPTASSGTPGYTYSWSPGVGLSSTTASNPTAIPAATTTYVVVITDVNGCTATDNIAITVHQNPVADAGSDQSIQACSSDSVQIGGSPTASGGGGSYTYTWTPGLGLSGSTIANPFVSNIGSTSNYWIVVTDQFGCTATDQTSVVVNNPSLVAEAGNDVSFCQGASVSVTLGGSPTAVGGTAPFSYDWTPGVGLSDSSGVNPVATPLVSTTYSLAVRDANGCVAEDTVRITINPRPVVNAGLPDTTCSGECIVLGGSPTATNGTGSYTYNWTPTFFFTTPTTIANPTVCPTNNVTYVVTATDSLGCSNTASVSIRVNQNPVANAGTDKVLVTCPDACVVIGGTPTATGGGGGYLYAWAPSQGLNNSGLANPSACNLSQDVTYNLTVTDANGCTAIDQILVDVQQSTLLADAGNDKSICAGQTTCITIGGSPSVSGGSIPYTIEWSPVTGICNSNVIANPDVNPTDTTTYVLLVTDALGCVAIDSMVVFANPAVTASVGPDTSICQGGSALLGGNPTGSGGTSPFTYNWSPGAGLSGTTNANPIATPLVTTAYCVTVTDFVGCSSSTCQNVNVNAGVRADAGQDQSITNCPGASLQIGGSPAGFGGSGNYAYAWSPNTGLNSSTVPNPFVTNITVTTTYTLTVTDNTTGCVGIDQVTITVNPSTLVAGAGPDKVFCSNSAGCIPIGGSTTGGMPPYLYQWAPVTGLSNGNIQNPCAAPLVTTTYSLTVTDQMGCSIVDSMVVIVSPMIAVNAGADSSICQGTSIVLGGNPSVVGGITPYTYAWSAGAFPSNVANPTATPVSNSSYTLTVTDSLGCSSSDLVNINVRQLPIANAGPDQTITSCSNDSAVLGGSPTGTGTQAPYTYLWSPASLVSNPTLPNPVVDSLGNVVVFTVTVTDVFGCQASDQVQVTATPPVINVEAGSNVGSICSNTGGCVMLGGNPTATGNGLPPYTYVWSGVGLVSTNIPNPQACPQGTTTYTVVVTDANGCQAADTVQVIVNTPTEASITGLNSQYCVGSPNVVMTGIPSGGTFGGPFVTGNVFQPVSAGTWCVNYSYTNTVTGCVDDTTICVTVNPLPTVTVSGYNANVCRDGAAQTLVGTPAGGTFSGSPGLSGANGEVFTPANATIGNNNITYTYTDPQTGCTNTFSFVVNVKDAPSINLASSSSSVCAGATAVITPTYSFDVFNIAWSVLGGGTIASGLSPITVSPTGADYCVIATAINTPNGCVARDTICIHVNQNPVAVDDTSATCEEQSVSITVLDNDTDPEGDANTVTVISSPNGTTSVNSNVIAFTPNIDFNGNTSITYVVCNTACPNACDTATVGISVCPVNDPPVIEDTTITIYQDDTADVCPTIYDVDGDPLVISDAQCTPLNGTITFTSDSCFQFIPTTGWTGTQIVCIAVCDTTGLCDTGTITIVVLPTNNAPVTEDIDLTVCDSTSIGINISAGTGDPDGDPVIFDYGPVTSPAGATYNFSKTGNGALVFQGDMPGSYTFEYYACDNSTIPVFSLCDTSLVTITVIDCDTVSGNLPPIANDDHSTTSPGTGIVINETANDFDPNGDPLTPSIISGPYIAGANAIVNPDGTISYTSPVEGLDSIVYQVCDPFGLCDTAIIYINITDSPNTNHPPVAVDDFETTDYLTPVVVNVLDNDHDPDGDSIHVTIIPCPASDGVGVVSGNGTTITYTPGPNANADNPDTLCYVICEVANTTSCDTANVVIYINNSVQGVADCGNHETGRENPIDIDVTANDFDPEADSFCVTSVLPIAGTTHGSGSVNNDGTIHYIPANDTCDYTDTISYVVQDVRGATDTVNVCIYINCCTTPVAVTDLATIVTNDVLVIDVQNNDSLFGVSATTIIVANGAHGSATVRGSIVTYTPSNNYCGLDTVQYGISSSCGADTGLLIVTVSCNQNPVAIKDNLTLCSNDTATINVLANDTDPDGDSLYITALGNPFPANLGFVIAVNQGNITFQSNGTAGTFSVNYIVCDNGLPSKCDTNSVIVQVLSCIVPDLDTIYDTTCVACPDTICIGDWVVGNNYPTISNICDPQNGTVEILSDSLCFVYTPDIDFIGNDTFCITVCDTLGDCDSSVVIITILDPLIQAVDEPCDLDSTVINTPITIAVLDNDIIPAAADTVVTLISQPVNGTAVVNTNNTVTYTPNTNYQGGELFSYLVCASSGAFSYCDTATICITVVDTVVECYIPNGFSPNGDGVNDNYVIPCKDRYPEATVRIFDRWGVEVWFSDGAYQNNWDGHNMQGIVLPDGTYYIIYEYLDGTGRREAKFVVIHR